MPVKSCGDGTFRIGDGPCQYDSKEKAESAYRGYLASEARKQHFKPDDQPPDERERQHADNLTGLDGEPLIYHRTGGRWRMGEVRKNWVPVQRYGLKLPEGSRTNPLGKAMERAGMDAGSQTALIDRVTNMGLPTRMIKIGPREVLYASQAKVDQAKVSKIPIDAGRSPIILKIGDRSIVIDGHHRIAKARARNRAVEATLFDANLLDVEVGKA